MSWQKRLAEASFVVSLFVGAVFIWHYFALEPTLKTLPLYVAIIAAIGIIAAGISWFLRSSQRYIACGTFLIVFALVSTLAYETGGVSSVFLPLWAVIAFFAATFGLWLALTVLILPSAYFLMSVLDGTAFTSYGLLIFFAATVLPSLLGCVAWYRLGKSAPTKRTAYNELASELSQVANKSDVVINAIADGVIAIDSGGVIRLINPAAQQLLGWGQQDATSLSYKSVLQIVTKDTTEPGPSENPVEQTLATNQAAESTDLFLTTNSGKTFMAAIRVSPVGQIGSGAIIVFRNITREKAEEREQAEFISTASHEMRTPVASIEGYLGLALNPATAQIDAKARDFITKAHESAQHLGRLFQDLLDVSKAEDGRLSNNPKVVDIVPFIHDIAEGLLPKAEVKGLRFLYKPQPLKSTSTDQDEQRLSPIYYVHLDSDHIRELVANLIENAIKYTPSGDVIVDITGDTDHVTISVADSGIGIPAEDIPHLFQKFYRVDNSDTREIGGTGLGLYLCRRLAETMGGRIYVESEYKKGSTFYLELPRIDHEEAMRLLEQATLYAEQQVTAARTAPQNPSETQSATASFLQTQTRSSYLSSTDNIEQPAVNSVVATPPAVSLQPPVEQPVQVEKPVVQPQIQAPIQPQQTTSQQTQQSERVNIPIASLEQDPGRYVRTARPTQPIAPRQNSTDKP